MNGPEGQTPESIKALHKKTVSATMALIQALTEVAEKLPPADRRPALCSFMMPGVVYAIGQAQAAMMMSAPDHVWEEVTSGTVEALEKGWTVRDEPTARKMVDNVANGRNARDGLDPELFGDGGDPLRDADEMLQRVRATRHP